MNKGKTSNFSGITLIALVITVIVLLILAGISISMLSGDNSILQRATDAKTKSDEAQIRERIQLAYHSALTKDITGESGELTMETLQGELNNEFTGKTVTITPNEDNTQWVIKVDNVEVTVTAGKNIPQVATLPSAEGTKPYYPSTAFKQLPGTNLTNGLVITDAADPEDASNLGNEYVWIEVPNDGTGPSYTAVASAEVDSTEYYSAIATALRSYCNTIITQTDGTESMPDSRITTVGYTDTWYEGCGIADPGSYTTLYNTMLKSVYTNGGFWIGRYEAGTEVARNKGDSASGITPLSKIDLYPINWVTCSEAQTIASSVPNKGTYNSSLMFGIQWDLVLRHLSNKGLEKDKITGNSETWGNYKVEYDLDQTTAHGYKGILSTSDWTTLTWSAIESNYVHNGSDCIELSTGASTRNMKSNIYDLAGNMFEWTLEKASRSSKTCAYRGGSSGMGISGYNFPASHRSGDRDTTYSDYNHRFQSLTLLM